MSAAQSLSSRTTTIALAVLGIVAACFANFGQAFGAETWAGLVIAPEHRCAPYDRDDYRYSQSVEAEIVAAMGGRIYGPYTGRYFLSTHRTDIEHIVAVSEGHDSGPLRRRPVGPASLRFRPAQPDPGRARGEPLQRGRQVRP